MPFRSLLSFLWVLLSAGAWAQPGSGGPEPETPSVSVLSITRINSATTNAASVSYLVNFDSNVTGLLPSSFTLNVGSGLSNANVSTVTGSGSSYTVAVGTGSGSGSLQLVLQNSTGINPGVSNVPFSGETYQIDKTQPSVSISSIVPAQVSPSNLPNLTFQVTFAASVSGLTISNFTTVNGGGVTGSSVSGLTPLSGTVYNVTVNTGSGSGTIGLTFDNDSGITPGVSNKPFTGTPAYTIDKTPPTTTISSTAGANGSTTSSSPIPFTVTFSEAVFGFVAGDVTVTGGMLSGFSDTSTSTYIFNVTPTSSGNTVTINVVANTAEDASGNGNTAASQFSLTYSQPQTTAPVVTTPANGALVNTVTPAYTGTAPANSTVTVYVDDSSIGTTTAGSGGNWNLTQPTALAQGNHPVKATAQFNGQAVSSNSNTNTFTVDTTAPTITISSSAGGNGGTTGASPIPFTVTFSESVTGFVAADMTVSGGTIANFAGSGTTYTFDVTPSANGLITVDVAANVAQDQANNGNTAASEFGITYSRPVTAIPTVVTPANGSLITLTKPTYTGTATPTASLTLAVDNVVTNLTTTVDASGNWTIVQPTDLGPGAHTVQARAQLSGQTASAYSAVSLFTIVVPAAVMTATPTGANSSGATLGGNVTDAGAGTVSERGVVYVVGNGTPTTNDTKVIIGAGTGSFAQAITNLTPSTTYSVRAYAINQAGTTYGAIQVFSTGSSLSIGSVTPSAVCVGASINITYTNSSPGTPLQVYLNGPSTANLLLTTLSPSGASGTITATVPVDRGEGQYSVYISGAGTTSGSVTLMVNAVPAAPGVTSPVSYCQNAVASPLSATPIAGASLRWYGTSGTPASDAPTPVVTIAGTTNYYVSQTANGCESSRAVISVIVRPLPQAPTTTPVAACQNTTPVSLSTGVTASQGASLRWYTAETTGMASASAPVPPTNTIGQTIYYVSQVINGCESSRAALTFTVNPTPVATLVNDGPLSCTKPAVTLTAGGGTSYRFGSGVSQVSSSNIATVSMSGLYSVTVTNDNGCSSTAETTVSSDQSSPQASLTNDGPLTCAKTTVTLTAAGNGSYRFSAGATQVGTGNQATITTEGIYSVTVTAANGCSATAQTTVDVNSTVAAPTLTASTLSSENAPISVTASGCSGTINWSVTGGTGTANGSVYTFTQPGNYALTATCTVGTCISPSAPSLTLQIRPGGFAINGVELVRCQLLDAGRGQYEISFTPQYSGLSGSPVSFSVANELAATTAPGPYTLRLYVDNAPITLTASQATAQASYRYNWLAACSGTQPTPNRPPVAQPIPDQVLVVGQNYQLDLTSYFTDPDGQSLTFTATNLPAGLQLSGTRITGSPTQAGSSTVQVTALDPGGLQAVGSVLLRVDPAPVTPTPGVFSIAGVTGVRCETLNVGERRLSFSPVYTGLTGTPISFGITNELASTTAPGPYMLRLYTDNPAITLQASQGGTSVSYRFDWLAACASNPTTPPPANRPPTVGTGLGNQTAQVGQGYTLFIPAGTFTDPDNDPLQLSVSGLPAGLNFSAAQNAITGTPVQAGSPTVQVTATDPGGLSTSTSFVLTVQPASTTPTPGVFSIAGVTSVRCETLSVGERRLSFSPVYTGLTGAPISFGITNELATTTAPGPYALRLYTDNPAITLQASQGGTSVSYRFDWLAACAVNTNGRQGVTEAVSRLSVVVLGNPVVGESAEIAIRGVEGQSVELSLTDLAGNQLHLQRLPSVGTDERVVIPVPTRQAITILQVSTANQHQSVKLIRP